MNARIVGMFSFTERDLATMRAALRYWQAQRAQLPNMVNQIATDGGRFESLSDAEIDTLCNDLNP